jgi:Uma2 family endonuclease
MSALPKPQTLYTFEEYLALEQSEDCRYEYFHGEVFAMAGGSLSHNSLSLNIVFALRSQLNKKCKAFLADVKLELERRGHYCYPDVLVSCDADDLAAKYWIKNPSLIVEIISESTENYDLGEKWKKYMKIPSLQYCLFVSQYEYWVAMYARSSDPQVWHYQVFEKLEEELVLAKMNIRMSLAEIYENISLMARENPLKEGLI